MLALTVKTTFKEVVPFWLKVYAGIVEDRPFEGSAPLTAPGADKLQLQVTFGVGLLIETATEVFPLQIACELPPVNSTTAEGITVIDKVSAIPVHPVAVGVTR